MDKNKNKNKNENENENNAEYIFDKGLTTQDAVKMAQEYTSILRRFDGRGSKSAHQALKETVAANAAERLAERTAEKPSFLWVEHVTASLEIVAYLGTDPRVQQSDPLLISALCRLARDLKSPQQ